jgi:drug/metabolite transporter (DMT)-like permease
MASGALIASLDDAPPAPSHAVAYAGLTVTTFGWASGFIAGKLALAEMTPLPVASWRYAVAASVLLPFAIRSRPKNLRAAAAPLALMMLCGGIGYPWLFLVALARTSATNTALLIALNPVITILLSPLVGEHVDRRRLAGVALALLGAAIVITHGELRLVFHPGDLVALAAACCWATFNLASRRVVAHLTPAFTNCVIYAFGGLALGILGRSEAPLAQLAAATPVAVGAIVAMALLSSVMSGQLFLVGVRTVGVSRTVVFVYLVPVLTALLATTVLGEPFLATQALGGAAVLAGVYWTTRG